MYRENADGTKDVTVIVLNMAELPKGTLQGILRLAKVSKQQFRDAL